MDTLVNGGVILLLILLTIVMIVAFIVDYFMKRKIYRRYDLFMRGKDAESLEDKIRQLTRSAEKMKDQEMATRDLLMLLNRGITQSLQKIGVVKYNAFPGMGGQSSFVLALLDRQDTGILLNVMHSRTSCYVYVKEITMGKAENELSEEEEKALSEAIAKRDKYFGDDDEATS